MHEIEPALMKRLFDPLSSQEGRSKNGDSHLGLGLYIAQQIAVAHGETSRFDRAAAREPASRCDCLARASAPPAQRNSRLFR